jgi:hypothetical protein
MDRGALTARAGAVVLAGSLALLAGGCQFASDHGGARFRCGEGELCPPGTSCVAGYCQPGGPDASGPGGDAGGDAGLTAGPCGTISLVSDDFEAAAVGWPWSAWSETGAALGRSGGDLVIEFSSAEDRWAGYTTVAKYHVEGGEVRARVVQAGGRYTVLELRSPAGVKAQILVVGQEVLRATVLGASGGTVQHDLAYDPEAHAHWRLRGASGLLHWETSPDGDSWTSRYQHDLAVIGEEAYVVVAGAGRDGDPAARLDSINAGVVPPAGHCAAAELIDPFDGPPLEPTWYPWADPGCTLEENGGDLRIGLPGDGSSAWCGVDSSHLFDLSASQLVIGPMSGDGGGPGVYGFAHLSFPLAPGTLVEVGKHGATLYGVLDHAGERTYVTAPHDPVAHRYWRLRGAGGRPLVDTSADAVVWNEFASWPEPMDLRVIRVRLAAGHDSGASSPAEIRFGGINAP